MAKKRDKEMLWDGKRSKDSKQYIPRVIWQAIRSKQIASADVVVVVLVVANTTGEMMHISVITATTTTSPQYVVSNQVGARSTATSSSLGFGTTI